MACGLTHSWEFYKSIQTKTERDTVVQYIYRNIVEVIMPILTWIARATDGMMLVCYAIEVST